MLSRKKVDPSAKKSRKRPRQQLTSTNLDSVTAKNHVSSPPPPAVNSPQPADVENVNTNAKDGTNSLPGRASPPTQHVLAWDIEKSGPRTDKNSMLALGATVLRVADETELSTFLVFMKMEKGHDFSEHCRKDYWYNFEKFPNNRVILERIENEGVSPRKGISKFAKWLDKQERTYDSLALATDNPASDAAWVSHYFQKYLDRPPMIHRYGDEKQYRRLHHSNAFARAVSLDDGSGGTWLQRLRDAGIPVPPEDLHDHNPLNDARWIAKLYAACINHVHEKRKHLERA